jgi:hypothetical protein
MCNLNFAERVSSRQGDLVARRHCRVLAIHYGGLDDVHAGDELLKRLPSLLLVTTLGWCGRFTRHI